MNDSLLNSAAKRARITVGDGQAQLIPIQWFKLLLRLRQLDSGCHTITLIKDKDGDSVSWAVYSAKVEG